jgi:hypothetical protein
MPISQLSQRNIWLSIQTSIVYPLEATSMSLGLMLPPLIMFLEAIAMKWTCHGHTDE